MPADPGGEASPAAGEALLARTRRLSGEVDLAAVVATGGVLFERGGAGLGGTGVAIRAGLSDVAAVLDGIEVDDEIERPGSGPVAFGALPFLPDAPAELVVPAKIWGRDTDGTCWVTTVGPRRDSERAGRSTPPPGRRASPGAPRAPGRLTIAPSRPAAHWRELVARTAAELRAQAPHPDGLRKVVLAREVVVDSDEPFDVAAVLGRLRAGYPGCYLYHLDGFLGASPELLVSRHGPEVRSQPMAGTAPRAGDPRTDARRAAALVDSPGYRHEHQVTIDMVYETLVDWCSYLDYEPDPSVVEVANVSHLATLVEGRLSSPLPSVLDLVAALHPTPAVAGWPRAGALGWIAAHEGLDRGRYGGAVGWVDREGNGTWAVAIRCGEIHGTRARVFAGNGIVAQSDPDAELAETQAKLQAMLGALIRV